MEQIIIIAEYPEQTCYACPTIFEFNDINGEHYYFRLRHGWWRLENETTCRILASGEASELDLDGICDWEEAKMLCASDGVFIKNEVE